MWPHSTAPRTTTSNRGRTRCLRALAYNCIELFKPILKESPSPSIPQNLLCLYCRQQASLHPLTADTGILKQGTGKTPGNGFAYVRPRTRQLHLVMLKRSRDDRQMSNAVAQVVRDFFYSEERTDDEDIPEVPGVWNRGGDDSVLGEGDHGAVVEDSKHDDQNGGEIPAIMTSKQVTRMLRDGHAESQNTTSLGHVICAHDSNLSVD